MVAKKGQRKRRFYKPKPRRQKTLAEVLKPQPNEIWCDENTGIYLTLEPARLWTIGELIAKFYEANEDLNPIAWELVEDYGSSVKVKDWYAIMYRGWHIRIIAGQNQSEGPHQTQLWFKTPGLSCPVKNIWVASLQLMGFFHNSDEMKANLLLAIKQHEFYMSDSDRDSTTEI